MKIRIVVYYCLTCLITQSLLAASSEALKKAAQYGAKAKVTFRVIDDEGSPVTNACFRGGFSTSDSRDGFDAFNGYTDTNGLFVVEGTSVGDMNYTVTKDGYYKSNGRYWFYGKGNQSVKDGCWQPWDPTVSVVLKPKKNPVPMYAKDVDMVIPIRDTPLGFDLEIGDWMAPHGKGKESDIFFTYSAKVQDSWTFSNQLVIACSNKMDGLYRTQKDMESEFHSAYEALSNGYQQQVVLCLDRTKFKILKREELGDGEYLVFRVRTVVDDKGNIISARYGKIYGPIIYGGSKDRPGSMRFTYYFNPDGTRNLEFDPNRNLFGWRSGAPERVSMP